MLMPAGAGLGRGARKSVYLIRVTGYIDRRRPPVSTPGCYLVYYLVWSHLVANAVCTASDDEHRLGDRIKIGINYLQNARVRCGAKRPGGTMTKPQKPKQTKLGLTGPIINNAAVSPRDGLKPRPIRGPDATGVQSVHTTWLGVAHEGCKIFC